MRNFCTACCLCSVVSKYVKQEITDLIALWGYGICKKEETNRVFIGFINI